MTGQGDDGAADPRAAFIDAMSRAVTGVTVVTTDGAAGRLGLTVSAMCSVSADPPMLLVCVNRRNPLCQAVKEHRVFAVNVLRADQKRVAEVFSGRPRRGAPYDFDVARWETAATGCPLLSGAVARFDCELDSAPEVGSHAIFVGRVVASSAGHGKPLVYGQRAFGELLSFPRQGGEPAMVTIWHLDDFDDEEEAWE